MEIIDLSLNGYLYLGVNHLHELSEEYVELLSGFIISRTTHTPYETEYEDGFKLRLQEIVILLSNLLHLGVPVGSKVAVDESSQ